VVKGMSAACAEAGIALVGGETAEMPGVYAEGDLDVVGFVTGVVDKDKLLTGASIVAGDVLYGVSSSGLHTNGWSLARKLLFEMAGYAIDAKPAELQGKSIADVLLAPHTNYVAAIRAVLDAGIPVKGMAHITGGGLVENVPRVLPEGLGAVIDRATWTPQPIFSLMQGIGAIDDVEMHRTFNMGVGLVMVAPQGLLGALQTAMSVTPGLRVWELGQVEAGAGVVRFGGV
jgi:phosphoribosylformylglycinamidine cyclo-ligase